MHDMSYLKQMLEKELGLLAMQDEITPTSLEQIHKLTDCIKNILKIEMLDGEGEYEGEYSGDYSAYRRNRSYGNYNRSYDGMYGDESSYARRRRDSMGRYARDDYSGRRRYSRGDGESEMTEHLERLMNEAQTEKDRQVIQRAISALRS